MGVVERSARSKPRLRELKKQRTRERIVHVAMELFSERGFSATTLLDISAAAEIAPSTLHSYFPTKSDIVFSHHAKVLESATGRLLNRPGSESTPEALESWVTTELPALVDSNADAIRLRRPIIDADQELLGQERLRLALLEDIFAQAFARDLGETPDDLRSRLMAALAVAGLHAIWMWSYRRRTASGFDPLAPYTLDGVYLTKMLVAAETAIEQIPRPD